MKVILIRFSHILHSQFELKMPVKGLLTESLLIQFKSLKMRVDLNCARTDGYKID